jgi:hypothetical protein
MQPQRPYFSQATDPTIQPFIPPPNNQNIKGNYFQNLIDKYKRGRMNEDLATPTLCKYCNFNTPSVVVNKNSFLVWILCIILLVATYVCFFLPFLFNSLKNKHIVCRNCGKTKYIVKPF